MLIARAAIGVTASISPGRSRRSRSWAGSGKAELLDQSLTPAGIVGLSGIGLRDERLRTPVRRRGESQASRPPRRRRVLHPQIADIGGPDSSGQQGGYW